MPTEKPERSTIYRDYYDKWGSRYYIFSSELEPLNTYAFLLTKEQVTEHRARVTDLKFNTTAFNTMGGEYVFSAIEITNARQIDLNLLNVFERTDSPWRIFLYQINIQNSTAPL
jgi:hypothetical protein